MKLIICAVGHRMPAWIADGFEAYASRMPREASLELVEVRPEPRPAKPSAAIITKIMAAEAQRILACLPARCRTIALDERGKSVTSTELADLLRDWMREGEDVAFVIGGADGLDAQFKRSASLMLSLSSLTLPHQLVRVLLAEQLYRASSVLRNHPYHRG
jgi:23S rRNA (pseudouridine1915-N3)-methyltransferase